MHSLSTVLLETEVFAFQVAQEDWPKSAADSEYIWRWQRWRCTRRGW